MSGPLIASDKESAYGYNSVRNSDASSKNNQLNDGKSLTIRQFSLMRTKFLELANQSLMGIGNCACSNNNIILHNRKNEQ